MKNNKSMDPAIKKALSSLNVEKNLPEDFEDKFLTEFKRRQLLESQVRPDTLKRYFDSHFTGFLNPLRVSIFGTAASVALIVMLFNMDFETKKEVPPPEKGTVAQQGTEANDTAGGQKRDENPGTWEKTLREVDEVINSILYFNPDRASMPQEP